MTKNDNLDKDLLRRAIRSVESVIDDTYTEVYHFHKPSLYTVLKAANLWLTTLEHQEPKPQSQDYHNPE